MSPSWAELLPCLAPGALAWLSAGRHGPAQSASLLAGSAHFWSSAPGVGGMPHLDQGLAFLLSGHSYGLA